MLQGQFLQFDLRNGNLRRKYDSLKYTLKVGAMLATFVSNPA